jgi:hypothetical protein
MLAVVRREQESDPLLREFRLSAALLAERIAPQKPAREEDFSKFITLRFHPQGSFARA